MTVRSRSSTACIIGGDGFVGTHLVARLGDNPNLAIRVLSRRQGHPSHRARNIEIIPGDLLDEQSLRQFLEPASIVINMAYMGDHDLSRNLQGVQNLARACGRVGVERLIHMSTAVVVGRSREDVITEMTPCRPLTQYEKVKLAMEHELLNGARGHAKVAILRPSEIFGEGGKGLVKLAGELIAGSHWRAAIKDMVYARRKLNLVCIDNVVAALWFLASTDTDIDGQCFLVSDDDAAECNYYDVVAILSRELGVRGPAHARIMCPASMLSALLWAAGKSNINPRRIYSCEKLREYGYKKAISFRDGLLRFAEWFKRTQFVSPDA